MNIPLAYRQGTEADKNFILSSWLKGIRQKRSGEFENCVTKKKTVIEQGHFATFMPHDLYFERFRPLIEHKLYPKSSIVIAYNPDFEDQIYGYIAYRNIGNLSVISFCYVKQPFRKVGIARSLFEVAKGKSTVSTYFAPWLAKAFRKEGIIFDPFFDFEF